MNRLLLWTRETFASAAGSSWLAAAAALGMTTALWLAAKAAGIGAVGLWPLGAAIQLCGLWAFTLFCLAVVAVGRSRAFEPVFGGFDRATRFHRVIGPAALVFTALHVGLLVVDAGQHGMSVTNLLVPFEPGARTLDIIATLLVLVLVALAFSRRVPGGGCELHVLRGRHTAQLRTAAQLDGAADAGGRGRAALPRLPVQALRRSVRLPRGIGDGA